MPPHLSFDFYKGILMANKKENVPSTPTNEAIQTGDPEAAATPVAKAKDKPAGIPALRIRAVPEQGFCRSGRRWTREPQVVPVSDFTPEQVAALKAEALLVVVETTLEPVEGGE